jgi:hypothetical protein
MSSPLKIFGGISLAMTLCSSAQAQGSVDSECSQAGVDKVADRLE